MNVDQILARARGLLGAEFADEGHQALKQATINLYAVVYGPSSPQVKAVASIGSKVPSDYDHNYFFENEVFPALKGAVRSLVDDIEGGVVGSLELRGAGTALADSLALAKEAMREPSDGAHNVAAVLAAATFEDTIRRMGSALAGVNGRPHLRSVLTSLKTKGLLPGALGTTADGLMQFRNDALHANWSELDRVVTASCVSFTEGLLMKHFSS